MKKRKQTKSKDSFKRIVNGIEINYINKNNNLSTEGMKEK